MPRATDRSTQRSVLARIVMWEMLVGDGCSKAYGLREHGRDRHMVTSEAVRAPRGGPPEVDEIVMRLLAKDPADRYQTADQLLEAIERVAVRVGVGCPARCISRPGSAHGSNSCRRIADAEHADNRRRRVDRSSSWSAGL